MTKTNDQITNLDAELDGLSSPTTADTYVVSKDYDPDVVAASAARRSLGGGGGGSQTVQQSQVTLLSSDILALADTPKVLVPGAAGVILAPLFLNITPGAGDPYTVEDEVNLYLGVNAALPAIAFIVDLGNTVTYALSSGFQVVKGINPTSLTDSSDSPVDARGLPLVLQVVDGGANPVGGTFDAVVTLVYASMTGTA